ncbi:peptidase family M48-domain-containing protein [Xylogone sp. PMI_703]|nr:peptidase family M48-domain-containing protein [Xylogone sp. PMI_703]
MLSRRLLQSFKPRSIPVLFPRATPTTAFSRVPSIATRIPRRFNSQLPRRFPPPIQRPSRPITQYDPIRAQNAKPLITVDQILDAAQSRSFKWIVAISCGSAVVFYFANLEVVPVSGRRRFNCYSEEAVEKEGEMMYRKIMQEYQGAFLPSWDPRTRMVRRVMGRLIPANDLEHVNWEVHVIESPRTLNAFVIPGGKVFVFTGIIPICKNDDGLAAILGHEIAHNVAQHAAEAMSSMVMLAPLRWALIFLDATGVTLGLGRILGDIGLELGIARPASRKQESEADFIGLLMMAQACYNPEEAVRVWQRMQKANNDGPPEWLSTHPSNANRIEKITKWLPKAREAFGESGCVATARHVKDFREVASGWGGFPVIFR